MRGLEHRVHRAGDAGGLRSPQRKMGLRQVRQHVGDHVPRPYAQTVEEVGRLCHAPHQLGVREDHRRLVCPASGHEDQRGPIAVALRRKTQHVESVPGLVPGLERSQLDAFDVGAIADQCAGVRHAGPSG